MKKISIPEPCHENWADFTPTQKGAFCGSCKIDVVDFSNKSPEQVKTILQDNAGKHICGRFKKTQLEDLNNDFFAWQNQSARSLQSKFLYACLVVFGMTLFTGCSSLETTPVLNSIFSETLDNSNAQLNIGSPIAEGDTTKKPVTHSHKIGKIKYTPEVTPTKVECETPPDSIPKNENFRKGKIAIIEEDFIKGDIDPNYYNPPTDIVKVIEVEDTTSKTPKAFEEIIFGNMMIEPVEKTEVIEDSLETEPLEHEEFLLGDIMYIPEEIIEDTIKVDLSTDTSSTKLPEKHLYTDEMIDGKIMIDPDFVDYVEDTTKTENIDTSTSSLNIPESFAPTFSAILYPNPTNQEATVQIDVAEKNLFNIYLYAIDGKQIKAIYDGFLERGIQSFKIDLSAYHAGSYLIVINSEKHKESLRLEKVE